MVLTRSQLISNGFFQVRPFAPHPFNSWSPPHHPQFLLSPLTAYPHSIVAVSFIHLSAIRSFSLCTSDGSLIFFTRPKTLRSCTTPHVTSTWYHSSPCLAEYSNAWWLLCHPSPHARSATHQLFLLRSPVLYCPC